MLYGIFGWLVGVFLVLYCYVLTCLIVFGEQIDGRNWKSQKEPKQSSVVCWSREREKWWMMIMVTIMVVPRATVKKIEILVNTNPYEQFTAAKWNEHRKMYYKVYTIVFHVPFEEHTERLVCSVSNERGKSRSFPYTRTGAGFDKQV